MASLLVALTEHAHDLLRLGIAVLLLCKLPFAAVETHILLLLLSKHTQAQHEHCQGNAPSLQHTTAVAHACHLKFPPQRPLLCAEHVHDILLCCTAATALCMLLCCMQEVPVLLCADPNCMVCHEGNFTCLQERAQHNWGLCFCCCCCDQAAVCMESNPGVCADQHACCLRVVAGECCCDCFKCFCCPWIIQRGMSSVPEKVRISVYMQRFGYDMLCWSLGACCSATAAVAGLHCSTSFVPAKSILAQYAGIVACRTSS